MDQPQTIVLDIVCHGVVVGQSTHVQQKGESYEDFSARAVRENGVITQHRCGR